MVALVLSELLACGALGFRCPATFIVRVLLLFLSVFL